MTRILSLFGLMRVSEHEAALAKADDDAYNSWIKVINERDFYVSEYKELEAKFKRAATDLEKQAGEIAAQKGLVSALTEKNVELVGRIETLKGYHRRDTEEINALRPDALAMRRKRQRDRDLKAAKAAKKVQP